MKPGNLYFLTATVVDWVDIFTRPAYAEIVINSLNHCITNKGLIVHAWVLMSNHLHLVAQAEQGLSVSDIIRDFKKFTSKAIIRAVHEIPESRSEWMLHRFEWAGKFDPKIKDYRFWQEGNAPKEIFSRPFLEQKINYTHQNPVRAGWVEEPEHYRYSSAMDYAGKKGLIKVEVVW